MSELKNGPYELPSKAAIAELPRWARVAFAARCARRVQPLFTLLWPDAPGEYVRATYKAITLAADAAADAADRAHHDVAAAAAGARAVARAARDAVHAAAAARAYTYTIRTINSDFQLLRETAKKQGWTDERPVPPDFFGPLWPDGEPEGWPESPHARTAQDQDEGEGPSTDETAQTDSSRSAVGGGVPTMRGGGLSDTDLLGREKLVASLAAMIASPQQDTPFTLALLGDWGSGKSNVMHLIQHKLERRPDHGRFEFAWFNAWEYEHTENMAADVAQEVLSGLVKKLGWRRRWWLRIRFGLRENGWALPLLVVGALAATFIFVIFAVESEEIIGQAGWGTGALGTFALFFILLSRLRGVLAHPLTVTLNSYLKLPSYAEHLGTTPVLRRHIDTLCKLRVPPPPKGRDERVNDRPPGLRRLCRTGFLWIGQKVERLRWVRWARSVIQKLKPSTGGEPRRLIVFVDDLDRCEPDAIGRTLDAIRLVMDVKNVVVVIGMDHRIAFRAVERQYTDLADDHRSSADIARDYLGKIIQLPVRLDRPGDDAVERFIDERLFSDAVPVEPEEVREGEADEGGVPESGPVEAPRDTSEPTPPAERSGQRVDGPHGPASQGGIKPPADLDLEEAMRDSTKENQLFRQFATGFGLHNPRQLTRLHNCYRLLKLLAAERFDAEQLLAMLFWLDFLYGQPKAEHNAMMQALLGTATGTDDMPPDVGEMLTPILPDLQRIFGVPSDDSSHYQALEAFVARLVLPHSESQNLAQSEDRSGQEDGEPAASSAEAPE